MACSRATMLPSVGSHEYSCEPRAKDVTAGTALDRSRLRPPGQRAYATAPASPVHGEPGAPNCQGLPDSQSPLSSRHAHHARRLFLSDAPAKLPLARSLSLQERQDALPSGCGTTAVSARTTRQGLTLWR